MKRSMRDAGGTEGSLLVGKQPADSSEIGRVEVRSPEIRTEGFSESDGMCSLPVVEMDSMWLTTGSRDR